MLYQIKTYSILWKVHLCFDSDLMIKTQPLCQYLTQLEYSLKSHSKWSKSDLTLLKWVQWWIMCTQRTNILILWSVRKLCLIIWMLLDGIQISLKQRLILININEWQRILKNSKYQSKRIGKFKSKKQNRLIEYF